MYANMPVSLRVSIKESMVPWAAITTERFTNLVTTLQALSICSKAKGMISFTYKLLNHSYTAMLFHKKHLPKPPSILVTKFCSHMSMWKPGLSLVDPVKMQNTGR